MYAILNFDGYITDFEQREVVLSELIHPDFQHLYIDIGNKNDLVVGDMYSYLTKTFENGRVAINGSAINFNKIRIDFRDNLALDNDTNSIRVFNKDSEISKINTEIIGKYLYIDIDNANNSSDVICIIPNTIKFENGQIRTVERTQISVRITI